MGFCSPPSSKPSLTIITQHDHTPLQTHIHATGGHNPLDRNTPHSQRRKILKPTRMKTARSENAVCPCTVVTRQKPFRSTRPQSDGQSARAWGCETRTGGRQPPQTGQMCACHTTVIDNTKRAYENTEINNGTSIVDPVKHTHTVKTTGETEHPRIQTLY